MPLGAISVREAKVTAMVRTMPQEITGPLRNVCKPDLCQILSRERVYTFGRRSNRRRSPNFVVIGGPSGYIGFMTLAIIWYQAFGIGFQELLIIGLLFLVIFGPSKLPQMARDLGRFLSEARRSMDEFKNELVLDDDENEKERRLK